MSNQNKEIVTQIQYNGDSETIFNLGTTFQDVYYTMIKNGQQKQISLENFYNHIIKFLNDGTFEMYSKKEPQHPNVKV